MNQKTMSPEFDPRIADWLEDDPDSAPGVILETVLAALPSIPQRRARRVPWRFPTMTRFAPIGAAAAITVVLVGGALFLLRPEGGGVGTSPSASPSDRPSASPAPASERPTASPSAGACGLVTSEEAENQAGIAGLGAQPTESGTGDETTCIYQDGGGNIVLRIAYTKSGGASAFEAARAVPGTQEIADLGDAAVFDPATSTLSFVKGDALVAIVAGTSSQSPDTRLATERTIGLLAAERVTSTQ